jgi:uncharacterized protein DUF6458
MRTATGLVLVAIGAILAFAVRTSPSFLNLQVAGWVIMLTGVAGMFIPRRNSGSLRRRIVVRRPQTAVRRPRGTAVDPGSGPRALGIGRVLHRSSGRAPVAEPRPPVAAGIAEQTSPGAVPAEETIEEFYQE